MSMTDPIADMLTRIRNALTVKREGVSMPYSNVKKAILEAMTREGYVRSCEVLEDGHKKNLYVRLKYAENGESVIRKLDRVSKPGRRMYFKSDEVRKVLDGLGISIVSTSKGVLSDRECRDSHVGGEVICEVW